MKAATTRIGQSEPTKKSRGSWFQHLCACYRKGYKAFLDGDTFESCPYKPSANCVGVQGQRIKWWQRGYKRSEAGLPEYDGNG